MAKPERCNCMAVVDRELADRGVQIKSGFKLDSDTGRGRPDRAVRHGREASRRKTDAQSAPGHLFVLPVLWGEVGTLIWTARLITEKRPPEPPAVHSFFQVHPSGGADQ